MGIQKLPRRLLALALTALLITGVFAAAGTVRADSALVLTLAADITEKQKQDILEFFGIDESDATVIIVTNADERRLLLGQYTEAQIGTKTISCALVNPTASGGIQVKTANMNLVTSGRIASLLSTSGITNCEVIAAAPYMVSGTGALTGVMMGYEQAMSITLDPVKQQMAIEESTTVSKIGKTIGQEEATLVVNDIKIRIVRDNAREEEEIKEAVDVTVDQIEGQLSQLAKGLGKAAPKRLAKNDREILYDYGRKISTMDYDYDSMKVTLQRVTVNAARAIGITDPITETFEDLSAQDVLPPNSILRATNDESMGANANITTTDDTALEETPAQEEGPALDDAVATVELNGRVYALFDMPMSWPDARDFCLSLHGDLVSVTTAEEQQAVEKLAAQSSKTYSWLGGKYDTDQGRWTWSDGESFAFANWEGDQPEGQNGKYFIYTANRNITDIKPAQTGR
ncbi:MAG: DUF1002 domain-containing protein, partial [Clostridia bacterium]|nr:DUF1002 domain-containing protein [Clostridia bacterium]